MIPYTLGETALTFFFKGKQHTYSINTPRIDEIIDSIINNDIDTLTTLIRIKDLVAKVSFGRVIIDNDDIVRCDGKEVPGYLAHRIFNLYEKNPSLVTPLIAFAEKLMNNITIDVREDLYLWLDRDNMPIFEDGDFMAYKVDIVTGKQIGRAHV